MVQIKKRIQNMTLAMMKLMMNFIVVSGKREGHWLSSQDGMMMFLQLIG